MSERRIAVITQKKITGKETIDAKGLVVAPGFIDTHFHWTRPIGYKLALRDGVTTAMDLEAGDWMTLICTNVGAGESSIP